MALFGLMRKLLLRPIQAAVQKTVKAKPTPSRTSVHPNVGSDSINAQIQHLLLCSTYEGARPDRTGQAWPGLAHTGIQSPQAGEDSTHPQSSSESQTNDAISPLAPFAAPMRNL
jgi:hypothetical protein